MEFSDITPETFPAIRRQLQADGREASEYALSYTWPWRSGIYSMRYGEACGCGVYAFRLWGREYFSFPFGAGDKRGACAEVEAFATARGLKPKFSPITARDAETLGDGWLMRPLPAIFDYVYRRQDLAELKGSKYQQKRNHIHRFEDRGPWRYGPVDVAGCRKVLARWLEGHPVDDELEIELEALERIFASPDLMGLAGGVLYSCGSPVAFALGEPLSERMFLASYEKAIPSVQGAFPMVCREFARREAAGYGFINRAAADAHPNLAKAKRSYHPAFMLEKFAAVRSQARFATPADSDIIVRLWRESFGDSEDLIRFFIGRKLESDNCLVIEDKAMAFFLELPDGMRYMYALCVRPDARRRGLAAEIIRTAQQLYMEPIALVPGDESLLDFYRKFGFAVSAPAERRRVELDNFAREFYRLAMKTEDPEVFASGSTMTYPLVKGYAVPIPLN